MKPNRNFLNQPPDFWATVKLISQKVGYTDRKSKEINVPTIDKVLKAFKERGLLPNKVYFNDSLTAYGQLLMDYFEYRASVLNTEVKENLMKKDEAEKLFREIFERGDPRCPLPYNKQKGNKARINYFTGIINMLIDENIGDYPCTYDASELTAFTLNKLPIRTLSRRVDGAFPKIINPIAIWEIKEYYYTTSFGSRVADGVYETMLDGLELKEVRDAIGVPVQHYLFIDAYNTWWSMGRSYLCRLIDILHMGLVGEVIFGREVVTAVPRLCTEWINDYSKHKSILD